MFPLFNWGQYNRTVKSSMRRAQPKKRKQIRGVQNKTGRRTIPKENKTELNRWQRRGCAQHGKRKKKWEMCGEEDGVGVTLLLAMSDCLIGDSQGTSFTPGDQPDTQMIISPFLFSSIPTSSFKFGSGLILNATSNLDPVEAQRCFKC